MNWSDYKLNCLRTWNQKLSKHDRIANACLGLVGEAGEISEPIKKYLYHSKPLDHNEIEREVGDVLYYLTVLCAELNLDLEQAMAVNVAKLKLRYP